MQTEATLAQSDVSDVDLVKRCQAGETEAFDELVTRYRTRVFGMIYNMVHSEQDAWDLAQDSFLKAWKSIGRFRGQSSFYTWIYRIIMNVTIDWLRKKQVKGAGVEFDDAIQLKEIEDMQYHEIAEALECSIGTVMSRLFYARKKLQNLPRDVYENV